MWGREEAEPPLAILRASHSSATDKRGTWTFRESRGDGARSKRLRYSPTDDASGAKPPLSQMAPSTTVKGVYAAKIP